MDLIVMEKTIKNLEMQVANYLSLNERTEQLTREAIKESIIQRFELCYENSWKHLKRYMQENLGLSEIPNSPKPILRIANENFLINDIEAWIKYANLRVMTAHNYSDINVDLTIQSMPDFIKDVKNLYEKLNDNKWI